MQAIPLAFFLFLAELAAGGVIVTALLDRDGEVSGGFLFLNGAFLVAFGLAGLWLRAILPAARMAGDNASATWLAAETVLWGAFLAICAIWLFCIRTERRAAGRVAGAVASAAGLVATGASSLAYAGVSANAAVLGLALLLGGLALGTAWSAMMLGHWYLVTPRLAPRPLLRLNAALAIVLAGQGLLATWALFSGAVETDIAWLYWLRVGVGVALPLALALPVWRTARVRSMMSATGLLYIALGMVLSGEIIAKALYFLAGLAT